MQEPLSFRYNKGMKHILIYTHSFYPHENANTNVLMPILFELQKNFIVDILTMRWSKTDPLKEEYRGFHISRYEPVRSFRQTRYTLGILALQDRRQIKAATTGKLYLKRFLHDLLQMCPKQIMKRWITETKIPWQPGVEQYLRQHQGVYEIFFSYGPIPIQLGIVSLACSGYFAANHLRWYVLQFDPYAAYIGNKKIASYLIKGERQVYQQADHVFLSNELYQENQTNFFSDFQHKMSPLGYMNLHPHEEEPVVFKHAKEKINCVFTGSLMDMSIRNPAYFYAFAKACGPKYVFHMVCYAMDTENRKLKERETGKQANILWYDRMPPKDCFEMMKGADILVNIANRSANQTPSKIFDYISMGKPIVNFYCLEKDSSLLYLRRYPSVLHISETMDIIQAFHLFEDFCKKAKNISYEEVKRLYADMQIQNAIKNLYPYLQ